MKHQRCKGTRDLLPPEMARFRHIEDVFRSCTSRWGYQEIRTPTLEYLHLFTATGTLAPNMLNRVYSFLDWDGWSGERVVLRPDGTIPTVRLYADNVERSKLARYFYVENLFAFEETGKESRERWQCGVELIGTSQAAADVELVLLALNVLGKLGLDKVELQLSHAGLIKALPTLPKDSQAILLDSKGWSAGFLKNFKASFVRLSPSIAASLNNFIEIAELLTSLGCEYRIKIATDGPFEYYTGVLFSFYNGDVRIGGGGRYDALIPLIGGGKVPASGFGLFVEPLMAALQAGLIEKGRPEEVLVEGETSNLTVWRSCFSVAAQLREAGVSAVMSFEKPGPKPRWLVSVKRSGRGVSLSLTDQLSGHRKNLSSPEEITQAIKNPL